MITIDRGEKKVFEIDLRLKNGRPFDLTGYDVLKAAIPKGEGAKLEINQTVNPNGSSVAILGNPLLGILQVTLGKLDTSALAPGERLHLDIEIDKAATPGPVRERFLDAINVVDSDVTQPS